MHTSGSAPGCRPTKASGTRLKTGAASGTGASTSGLSRRFEQMLPELLEARANGTPYKLLAEMAGIHRNTLYRYLKATNDPGKNEK